MYKITVLKIGYTIAAGALSPYSASAPRAGARFKAGKAQDVSKNVR
jgi:hypothetical protein